MLITFHEEIISVFLFDKRRLLPQIDQPADVGFESIPDKRPILSGGCHYFCHFEQARVHTLKPA